MDNNSVLGNIWQNKLDLKKVFDEQEILDQIIKSRNIQDINSFLNPKLRNYLNNISDIKDLKKGTDIAKEFIEKGQKIGIISDYDVDGVTSLSIFSRYFNDLNIEFSYYIPNRFNLGYGVSDEAFNYFAEQGVNLVLVLDSGSSAKELLERYIDKFAIIVIDHHITPANLPVISALINPKNPSDNSDFEYLCSAGLSFLFILLLNSKLAKSRNLNTDKLLNYLDLVAIGSVCDSVPLIELNRAFVFQGLKVINRKGSNLLKAFFDILEINKVDVYTLGFIIGPRLNAAGRLKDASFAYKLLSCDDYNEIVSLLNYLNVLNNQRKVLQHKTLDIIYQKGYQFNRDLFCLAYGKWHEGIIGILASRVKDNTGKVSFIGAISGDEIKFSARSILEVDLGQLIQGARTAGVILNGGGHAAAAGFSIANDQESINAFVKYCDIHLKKTKINRIVYHDAVINLKVVNLKLVAQLAKLEPFGQGNHSPKFIIHDLQLINQVVVGKKHVKCKLKDSFGNVVDAIIFNVINSNNLLSNVIFDTNKTADFSLSIKENKWRNNSVVQILIHDIKR